MVDEEITDGRRIAQLLASELTGLSAGPVERITIVDADPDVTPTPDGADAFDIVSEATACQSAAEATDGRPRLGTVRVTPTSTIVHLEVTVSAAAIDETAGLRRLDGDATGFVIERGAAVKGAVDCLRAGLAD